MPKSRFSAIVSLLLVFLSGALVGAVTHRLYTVSTVRTEDGRTVAGPAPREDPEVIRKRILADMRQRLTLDDEQVTKLNGIYDETRKRFDELHQKANSETRALWENQTTQIRALLRPEQEQKYESYRREREEERKRRKKFDQKGPPGPPPSH